MRFPPEILKCLDFEKCWNQQILFVGKGGALFHSSLPAPASQPRYLPDPSWTVGSQPPVCRRGSSAGSSRLQLYGAWPGHGAETSPVSPLSLRTRHGTAAVVVLVGLGLAGETAAVAKSCRDGGDPREAPLWYIRRGSARSGSLRLESASPGALPAGICCHSGAVAGSSITHAFSHWGDCRDCDKLNPGWEVYFAWH